MEKRLFGDCRCGNAACIVTRGYGPAEQGSHHVHIALQAADDLTSGVQAGDGSAFGGKHLHLIIDVQTAQRSVITDVQLQRVEGAFLALCGLEGAADLSADIEQALSYC